MDRIKGFISEDGLFRIVAARTKDMSNHLSEIHHFSFPVMNAMSRFITGAILLSSNLKGNDTLGVYLNCSGPLAGMRSESNATGQLKAFAIEPQAGVDETDPSYGMDLGQLIGAGTLTVTKTLSGGQRPFTGTVQIEGDKLAIGFSRYLMNSDQIHSAIMISNLVSPDGTVKTSAGMLIQALPGASGDDLSTMEKEIQTFPPFSEVVQEVDDCEQAVRMLFGRFNPAPVFERSLDLHCSCSMDKVVRVLKSLAADDLEDVRQEDGFFRVTCDYCKTEYPVRLDEMRQ